MGGFPVTAGNPSTDGLPAVFFALRLRDTRQFLLDPYAYTARRPTPTGRAGAGSGSPPLLKSFTYFPRNRVTESRKSQKRMGSGAVTWKLSRRVATRNRVTAPAPWADSPPAPPPGVMGQQRPAHIQDRTPLRQAEAVSAEVSITAGTSAWQAYKPAYTPA